MGRTNPTFRDFLDGYEERWSAYRRALRKRHRDDFDRLFARVRDHADAAGHQNATDYDAEPYADQLVQAAESVTLPIG